MFLPVAKDFVDIRTRFHRERRTVKLRAFIQKKCFLSLLYTYISISRGSPESRGRLSMSHVRASARTAAKRPDLVKAASILFRIDPGQLSAR